MKKIVFLFGFFLFGILFESTAQINSDCTVSASLESAYEQDVKNMAYRRMLQVQSADTALVLIHWPA